MDKADASDQEKGGDEQERNVKGIPQYEVHKNTGKNKPVFAVPNKKEENHEHGRNEHAVSGRGGQEAGINGLHPGQNQTGITGIGKTENQGMQERGGRVKVMQKSAGGKKDGEQERALVLGNDLHKNSSFRINVRILKIIAEALSIKHGFARIEIKLRNDC